MKGIVWPEGTRETQKEHALRHVKSADAAIKLCKHHRLVVQAGGNVGLWPLRYAEAFEKVITFEPDSVSRAVLMLNTERVPNIEVRSQVLGRAVGHCAIDHRSLGSHNVREGNDCEVIALDDVLLDDVDLLQLDIEGYEHEALLGSEATIRRCRPVIQVELREFTKKYGSSDAELIAFLASLGYREVSRVPGSDVIFQG